MIRAEDVLFVVFLTVIGIVVGIILASVFIIPGITSESYRDGVCHQKCVHLDFPTGKIEYNENEDGVCVCSTPIEVLGE